MSTSTERTREVLRYAAFSSDPTGGNPAGVVLDATGMTPEQMLHTAAQVGYSETAFLTPNGGQLQVRYFSPLAEVSFCGHATIASAVAHAERHGEGRLTYLTRAGRVDVTTDRATGRVVAGHPHQRPAPDGAPRRGRPQQAAGRAGLVRRRPRPRAAGSSCLRRRLAPRPSRADTRPARRPGLRLRQPFRRS